MLAFTNFKFKLHFLLVVVIVHGAERSGLFQGISNFDGLSTSIAHMNNKRRCSARFAPTSHIIGLYNNLQNTSMFMILCLLCCRCLESSCRGIHFDGGTCKILYETDDIPESERNKFNPISLTSNEENLLVNGKIYRV